MNNPNQDPNGRPMLDVQFDQTLEQKCDKCNHDVFIQAFKMRKLSALLSPTGEPTMIPIQVFACAKCGHINKEFLPKEALEEMEKNTIKK